MHNPEEKTEGAEPLERSIDQEESLALGDQADHSSAANDFLKLRQLLLGDDYSEAIARYISKEENVERVVEDLPKALKESSQEDLSETLAPVVDQAIGKSIEQNPSRITNIIYPIMGPAVRKAVSAALADMVQSLNTLLEQSLTLGSVRWRIQAWRAGMPYAKYVLLQTIQYRVEQVLLVHKDSGLLLNSVMAPEVEAQDPELVSSMLTAISDFVSDSFSGGKETLERIRFGDLELHLYVGPKAILAVAVRGSAPDELFEKAHETIEQIHSTFGKALNNFEGNREEFEDTDRILSECLLSQKISQKAKRKPWLAVMLILGFFAYLTYESIGSWQLNQQFKQLEVAINNQAGYVVISTRREGHSLYVKALRSPESQSAEELELFLGKQLNVSLNIDANVVHFGPLPKPVVKEETQIEIFQSLIDKLQNTAFYFEAGEVNLSEAELLKIPKLVTDITELERVARENSYEDLQIILMGFADSSGSSIINNKVSQKRADEIKKILTANNVNSSIVVTWGVGHIDGKGISDAMQRRVTLQVLTINKYAKPTKNQSDRLGMQGEPK